MYIAVQGRPTKVQLELCTRALAFYSLMLLGKRLDNKTILHLRFKKIPKKDNLLGYCEYDSNVPHEYKITVDKILKEEDMLITLAHEMVHVKQYAKGELYDYVRGNRCRWQGKAYDLEQVDFRDFPWEIDAKGREEGLYERFREHDRDDGI